MTHTSGIENQNPSEQVTPTNTDSTNIANRMVATTTANTPARTQTAQQRMTNFFTGRPPDVHNNPGNPSPILKKGTAEVGYLLFPWKKFTKKVNLYN